MEDGGVKPAGEPSRAHWSAFGGLWTDRLDALEEIDRRLVAKRILPADAELLRDWVRNGYVVIRNAVPSTALDAFSRDVERAWREGDERLKATKRPGEYHAMTPEFRGMRLRVVDFYVYWPSALALMFADPIVHFLQLVFDRAPLAFQSLSFDEGSEQFMHQDTAFVVVNRPLELAASWVALEDVEEGSGELMYFEGSHRLEDFVFGGARKHWDPERDSQTVLNEYAQSLTARAAERRLPLRRFRPSKGDALIWSADLVHGGSQIADPARTRRSLVTHYCPEDVDPHYFSYAPGHRRRGTHKGCQYSSQHYVLEEAPSQTIAPLRNRLWERLRGRR